MSICVVGLSVCTAALVLTLAFAVVGNWQFWGPERHVSPFVIRAMTISGTTALAALALTWAGKC
jgi:hypothetical protein